MSSRPRLKCCPHCGGTTRTTVRIHGKGVGMGRFFIVECVHKLGGCGATISGKTKRIAAENWNRRFDGLLC